MGCKFDYGGNLDQIRYDLERLGKSAENLESKTLKQACEVVAAAVRRNITRSNISEPGYTHMQDDVQISNAKRDRDGAIIRTIGGSRKKTGPKWHLLELGTYSRNNATHFMEKSLKQTESEVDSIFDAGIKNMLGEIEGG